MMDKLKLMLQEAPPAMAFEISEAGIAAAGIGGARNWISCPSAWHPRRIAPLKKRTRSGRFMMCAGRRARCGANGAMWR
jgi:hypothetical protein